MIVSTRKLIDARQTGKLMRQMVQEYFFDMSPWASMDLNAIFEKIKNIPFQADPDGVELLKRPYYTMNRIGPGGDCDDKSIALASWAQISGFPWEFVAVGMKRAGRKKVLLSHVYTIIYISGSWITADATYAFNILGKTQKRYDRLEII